MDEQSIKRDLDAEIMFIVNAYAHNAYPDKDINDAVNLVLRESSHFLLRGVFMLADARESDPEIRRNIRRIILEKTFQANSCPEYSQDVLMETYNSYTDGFDSNHCPILLQAEYCIGEFLIGFPEYTEQYVNDKHIKVTLRSNGCYGYNKGSRLSEERFRQLAVLLEQSAWFTHEVLPTYDANWWTITYCQTNRIATCYDQTLPQREESIPREILYDHNKLIDWLCEDSHASSSQIYYMSEAITIEILTTLSLIN